MNSGDPAAVTPASTTATTGAAVSEPAGELTIGMCFDRSYPAGEIVAFARRVEASGLDQLWVIEDCFYTAGVSLAAAALASTEYLTLGLGILPAVSRNPAVTAMEIATLCNIAPGRVLPGIGHGVQAWMAQMGARTPSPLTTLEEVIWAVRQLLHGHEVSYDGWQVKFDEVRLAQPPSLVPPLLAGCYGPRSLALAGSVADGVVLAEAAGPDYVRWAISHAGSPQGFRVALFAALCVQEQREQAYRIMAPFLAALVHEPNQAVRTLPFYDDMVRLVDQEGDEALAKMPADWWAEIGPIGTMDDAVAFVHAAHAAGAQHINMFPARDFEIGVSQIDDAAELKRIVGAA